jgi:hypothetical protein
MVAAAVDSSIRIRVFMVLGGWMRIGWGLFGVVCLFRLTSGLRRWAGNLLFVGGV